MYLSKSASLGTSDTWDVSIDLVILFCGKHFNRCLDFYVCMYSCIHVHVCATWLLEHILYIPVYTLNIQLYTLYIPVYTLYTLCIELYTPAYTCIHPVHTCIDLYTPVYYQLHRGLPRHTLWYTGLRPCTIIGHQIVQIQA